MDDDFFELDCESQKRFRDTQVGTGRHPTDKDKAAKGAIRSALNAAYLQLYTNMLKVKCVDDDCPIRQITATIHIGVPESELVRTFLNINGSDKEWKSTVTVKSRCIARCLGETRLFEGPAKVEWETGELTCDDERENHGTAKADATADTEKKADKEATDKAEGAAFAASNRELRKLKCPADCPVIKFTYVQKLPKVTKRRPVLGGGVQSEAECEWAHRISCARQL